MWWEEKDEDQRYLPPVCLGVPENPAIRPGRLQTQRWPWACYTFHNFQTAPTLFSGKTASALSHDIPKKGTAAPDYSDSLYDLTIEELKQHELCQNQ